MTIISAKNMTITLQETTYTENTLSNKNGLEHQCDINVNQFEFESEPTLS